MGLTRSFAAFAAGSLAVVGCGDPDAAVPLDAPPTPLSCQDDFDQIVELLRIGAPTYDFDPASDLAELAHRAHVVVTGPVDRLTRSDDGQTIVAGSSGLSQLGPHDAAAPTGFDIEGNWAQRDVADPLAEPITVDGLTVVAFLHDRGDGSGRWVPDPQGLLLACTGSDSPMASVFETVPDDMSGLAATALTDAVVAAFDPENAPEVEPPTDAATNVP